MPLFHKSATMEKTQAKRKFLPLRLLSIAAFFLYAVVIAATIWFAYASIYSRQADIAALESQGLPHVIQFDRLEKIEADWNRKQNETPGQNIRDPFRPGATTSTTKTP